MSKRLLKLTNNLLPLLAAASISLFAAGAKAQEGSNASLTKTNGQQGSQDISACWKGAAQYHSVDVWLLYSIAWVESRMNPLSVGKNTNGSLDLGMMQINTIWLPELAKYGIKKDQLLDGCTSIYIGAWIMSKNIKTYGYTWRAIGAYNSGNVSIGYKYAQKVYDTHRRITGMPTVYSGSPQNR